MRKLPGANPRVILNDEFEDGDILFNPQTGRAYGLNPLGRFIFENLNNGKNSMAQLIERIRKQCHNVPESVEEHVAAFIKDLEENGFLKKKSEGEKNDKKSSG